MLKTMRARFILSAVAAFGIVMCILACVINVVNFSVTASRQDDMLSGILEYEQMRTEQEGEEPPMISDQPWANGPEADYTTRFFVVYCNTDGTVTEISEEHIASVDESVAEAYAQTVLSKNKEKGYQGEYRYRIQTNENETLVAFLNVAQDQKFVRSLLLISILTVVASLVIVFILVLIFSRRAIRPYMENMKKQKQFITDAGHELKTPIASISTSADILALDQEENEWVENIRKQTAKLTGLVKNLVELARLDEELPFPEKTDFSLSEICWEISEPFAALAGAAGKLYSQKIEEDVHMTGDMDAIRHLISILLDNAVRYSNEGGTIRFVLHRIRNKIYMEVTNTCSLPDIPDLDRLFDRFYRPDESRTADTGGTGIGLAMARSIAAAHGGRITARSADGGSITFTVIL